MDDTTAGYEAEPSDVDGLLALVCGEEMEEPDPLVRYTMLTGRQALVDQLVSRIRVERGRALGAMLAVPGADQGQVGRATGLSQQRVSKLAAAG